ncbi:MAG: chemotaxis protein CheW [Butyrivibrio sp.]|nr:chemotaxis protein CheW [Butyrivibrio sp.]
MENAVRVIGDSTAKQYIVVKIGSEQYGINIKYVDNIVRMQTITRVPKSQPYFVGVINLRGEIVPVMSLRRKFGIEDAEPTGATRIIILKPEPQATVGFIVDSVREVVTLDEDMVEKNNVNENAVDGQSYISAVGKNGDELISLLNIHTVIQDKEQI